MAAGTGAKRPPTGSSATGPTALDLGNREFWIGLIVVVLSIVSALATYLILTGLTPITPRDEVVLGALMLNVVLIAAMIGVIAWQGWGMWRAWRDRIAGARLHIRIVLLFSLIAALPAIILAIAATTTFSHSLDGWFQSRTRAIISNSIDVANAYVDEHAQLVRTDIANMVRDLDAAAADVAPDSEDFRRQVVAQATLRELPIAYVVDADGKLVMSAFEDQNARFVPVPAAAIRQADAGQVALSTPRDTSRVSAVARLNKYPGRYLYVSRELSPNVIGHLQKTAQSVEEYNRLRQARRGLKLAHSLLYFMIAMTALLAAIWVGLWFTSRFVAPIRRLIGAAQEVQRGNLAIELPERRGEGDLRRLSHTFNTMTRELKHQRDALVSANEQLLERRRFMEAVLSGVSAGVIGLDSQDRITLLSRSAEQLLDTREKDVAGLRVREALPMLAPVFDRRDEQGSKARGPLQLTMTVGGEERTFAVQVTRERAKTGKVGSVVTLDDVTELVTAQRTTAWADVARRIAHEIKNPLTPIILSAERIRRKYGRTITEDRETFDKLTATIERQAGDIKTMVDEFASFARIPKPVIERSDLREALYDPVILFRESHPHVTYVIDAPDAPLMANVDRRLITQALTNLVKNATEAVAGTGDAATAPKDGRVEVRLHTEGDTIAIDVIDNGPGLPKHNRAKLLEPYVTTKGNKGTGLGLAIVQKIVEQHNGELVLDDAPPGPGRTTGACMSIRLPASIATDPRSDRPLAAASNA